jgi:hypothetical protein
MQRKRLRGLNKELICRTVGPIWEVEFSVPEEKILFWREEYLARLGGK